MTQIKPKIVKMNATQSYCSSFSGYQMRRYKGRGPPIRNFRVLHYTRKLLNQQIKGIGLQNLSLEIKQLLSPQTGCIDPAARVSVLDNFKPCAYIGSDMIFLLFVLELFFIVLRFVICKMFTLCALRNINLNHIFVLRVRESIALRVFIKNLNLSNDNILSCLLFVWSRLFFLFLIN